MTACGKNRCQDAGWDKHDFKLVVWSCLGLSSLDSYKRQRYVTVDTVRKSQNSLQQVNGSAEPGLEALRRGLFTSVSPQVRRKGIVVCLRLAWARKAKKGSLSTTPCIVLRVPHLQTQKRYLASSFVGRAVGTSVTPAIRPSFQPQGGRHLLDLIRCSTLQACFTAEPERHAYYVCTLGTPTNFSTARSSNNWVHRSCDTR